MNRQQNQKRFFDLTKEQEERDVSRELRTMNQTLQSIEDLLTGVAMRKARA